MKSLLLLSMVVSPWIALNSQADAFTTLNIANPIAINHPMEDPTRAVLDQITALDATIRLSYPMTINPNTDTLVHGKLVSAFDFSQMDAAAAAVIVNENHCELSDAMDLYGPDRVLQGSVTIHAYTTAPSFVLSSAGNVGGSVAGDTSVVSIYSRDYFVVSSTNHDDVSAFIRCFTTLKAASTAEMQTTVQAYQAQPAFADLSEAFGIQEN